MNDTEITNPTHCIKCERSFDSTDAAGDPIGLAAWDGNGNGACWDCFRTWNWKVFGADFVYQPRPW